MVRLRPGLAAALLLLLLAVLGTGTASAGTSAPTYRNPVEITIPGDGRVESCADPSIIKGQTPGDRNWYLYCTTDPLNDEDKNAAGEFNFNLIPQARSSDLVHWTYVGNAFTERPSWAAPTAGLWAPQPEYFNGKYYLYFTVPETTLPGGGSAIGVATSSSPTGPWTYSDGPVVEPHGTADDPAARRWVFDPDVIESNGVRYIYYGSYFGGISVRRLSADGLHSDPATQKQIAIGNRYEGAFLWRHGGYWYLFGSATNCCNGPLTGYSVFAGRSVSPLGPFVDREGVSLLAGRVGGTPVISMNGNRWTGPGHNAVFKDANGQDWFLYHAVDRTDPYFAGAPGFTKRPTLLDRLDWVRGWPTVRAGRWASETPQRGPAAQPSRHPHRVHVRLVRRDRPGRLLPQFSDDFNGTTLSSKWTWVREPSATTFGVEGGVFRFDTQAADLFVDSNNASVLTESAPRGDYLLETRVHLNLPPEGCCHNYVQAGTVVERNDDNFVKLVHVSIWETRQTEWAKEWSPVPTGWPRYGNAVVGPPSDWTYLRIAVRRLGTGAERYTAYTSSTDRKHWIRGATWTHRLGQDARIGLVSMGGAGFTAKFDYVHVYTLRPGYDEARDLDPR